MSAILEYVRSAILAMACLATIAFVVEAHPHYYLDENAGVVAWDCGPGFEFYGAPGFFIEARPECMRTP